MRIYSTMSKYLIKLQAILNFEGLESPQFASPNGLGRVGVGGFFLGLIFGSHLTVLMLSLVVQLPRTLLQWAIYMLALSGFHFSEFLVTALYKPGCVSYDSYIINHSLPYTSAALASWFEFWVETLLLPASIQKFKPLVFGVGVALVIVGQVFRAAAMWTAKSHFSHIIMERKEATHELVQHGVYSYLRHPSYFGWFWWCTGTQMILCNPVCVLAYTFAAWRFFSQRIPYEEATLCSFYPNEYEAYMARTWIGIPFLSGLKLPSVSETPPSRKGD